MTSVKESNKTKQPTTSQGFCRMNEFLSFFMLIKKPWIIFDAANISKQTTSIPSVNPWGSSNLWRKK